MSIFSRNNAQDMPDPGQIAYRPSTAEGSFYPSDADSLMHMLGSFVDTTTPTRIRENIIGLVAPHAGYVYCGKVAGKSYKELKGRKYDAVIIIAPSHFNRFNGSSVFNGEAYTTPLGNVLVDRELAKEIAGIYPTVRLSREGHGWNDSINEHAIEVQLPFLQYVLPNTPIVPIVMGTQDFQSSDVLVKAIVAAVKKLNRNVLLVASSDMSHYHDKKTARSMDIPAGYAFGRYDYFQLGSKFFSREWEACGAAPIVTVMTAAEQLGADKSTPISYMTSADSEYGKHDTSKVVGYLSGVLSRSGKTEDPELPELIDDDKAELLKSARNAVERIILEKDSTDNFYMISKSFSQSYAAFVTLKKHDSLRACMGHIYPHDQLLYEVTQSARLAATHDYRFGPLDSTELKDINYEITILSRFKKIYDAQQVEVGRDGLYIRLGDRTGLLLPQVATDRHWDRQTFLDNVCVKANLPKDAWQNPQTEIFIFRAEIIKEGK